MDYYQQYSQELSERYDSLNSEDVHAGWIDCLSKTPGTALDIGAGSGRDARWLYKQGWHVTAIEPCDELREPARQNSPKEIIWLNDKLPKLSAIVDQTFDLILVSAMWMHLDQNDQRIAYKRLTELTANNGLLVISWRNQANDTRRQFHAVDETIFRNATIIESNDKGGRDEIVWKCAVLQKYSK